MAGQRFNQLDVASSIGGSNEFLIDQDGVLYRVNYSTFSGALLDSASAAGAAAANAVSGNLQSQINLLEVSVTEAVSKVAVLSAQVAQVSGAVTQASLAAEVSGVSIGYQTQVNAEASSRAVASAALADGILAEASSRIVTDAALTALVVAEASSRAVASAALADGILAEASSRVVAFTALADGILAEASSRAVASAALAQGITDEASSRAVTSAALAAIIGNSVARLDADNNFQSNRLTNYFWDVETTTGPFTLVSSDSGKLIYINNGATSINLNLVANLPLGWNITLVQGGTGIINVSAQGSTSLVNASAHTALNNQYSGVVLAVVNQEGTNSHAWYWLQGETQ